MKTFVIASEKDWHIQLVKKLQEKFSLYRWILIDGKEKLNYNYLNELNPEIVFFPHWSHIIPKQIFSNFTCVVFHMTDLPYGRGGSPLQNLILAGKNETKLSAIKVEQGIDTGSVYIKKDLDLSGAAWQIFERATILIEEIIIEMIDKPIQPIPQTGESVIFKRRKLEESQLPTTKSISDLYDFIRMLDAPGYPLAFIEHGEFRFEFKNAELNDQNELIAHVRILKK